MMFNKEYLAYDISCMDYDKRVRIWRQLTRDIILDYKKLLTELKQKPEMKVEEHGGKVLSTSRTRNRMYRDYVRLISGNHNKYSELREIYVAFLNAMDKVEAEFRSGFLR